MGDSSNKHNPSSPKRGVKDEQSALKALQNSVAGTLVFDAAQTREAGAAPPQTCCANCQTVFEVSTELLASSDTRVRCGECLSIFDALINLRRKDDVLSEDSVPDENGRLVDAGGLASTARGNPSEFGAAVSEHSKLQADTLALEGTYSDFDLFSGEAGLPEVAYFDQTQDLDQLRFDEPDGDETFSDTLFAHDMTIESPVQEGRPGEAQSAPEPHVSNVNLDEPSHALRPGPAVYTHRDTGVPYAGAGAGAGVGVGVGVGAGARDRSRMSAEPRANVEPALPEGLKRRPAWVIHALLGIMAVVVVFVLYGFINREVWLNDPDKRPLLTKACALVGCELTPLVKLDELKVLKRSVFSHPTVDNALVIDLAFVNEAQFDQPFPLLEIRLTDRNGGLVVQNDVAPDEYLDNGQADGLLTAGERLDLSITVEDPGQTATSFELKFR